MASKLDIQCVPPFPSNQFLEHNDYLAGYNNHSISTITNKNDPVSQFTYNKDEVDAVYNALLKEKDALLDWSTKILNKQVQSLEIKPQTKLSTQNNNALAIPDPQTVALPKNQQQIGTFEKDNLDKLYNLLLKKYQEINQQNLSLLDGIEELRQELNLSNQTVFKLDNQLRTTQDQQTSQKNALDESLKNFAVIKTQLAEALREIEQNKADKAKLEEELENANKTLSCIQNGQARKLLDEQTANKLYVDAIDEFQSYMNELGLEIKNAFKMDNNLPVTDEIKINGLHNLSYINEISNNFLTTHVKLIANAMQIHENMNNKYKKKTKAKKAEAKKVMEDLEELEGKYQNLKKMYYNTINPVLTKNFDYYKAMMSINEISFYIKRYRGLKLVKGYIKLHAHGYICWGKNQNVNTGQIYLKDVLRVDYGKDALFTKSRHDGSLCTWRCFSISHKNNSNEVETMNFIADTDELTAKWVLGLHELCGLSKGFTRGSFYRNMAKMKIENYAKNVKKSVVEVWKEAIHKTIVSRHIYRPEHASP